MHEALIVSSAGARPQTIVRNLHARSACTVNEGSDFSVSNKAISGPKVCFFAWDATSDPFVVGT